MIPLALAAVTTIVSFLANVTSPLPANVDFGIVAAIGVGFGLIIMLTLLTAARALVDGWRESHGSLRASRSVSDAIPNISPLADTLGGLLAQRPGPFLVGIGVITVLLGIASLDIETVFDTNEFLPSGGEAVRNIESIEAAFGGSVENVNVLIQTEVTDDRAIRNMLDFADAFFDDLRRPEGVVGGIQSSLGLLFEDWITDDGTEGDNYDPELHKMALAANEFRLDPAQIQAIIDRLERLTPASSRRWLWTIHMAPTVCL